MWIDTHCHLDAAEFDREQFVRPSGDEGCAVICEAVRLGLLGRHAPLAGRRGRCRRRSRCGLHLLLELDHTVSQRPQLLQQLGVALRHGGQRDQAQAQGGRGQDKRNGKACRCLHGAIS